MKKPILIIMILASFAAEAYAFVVVRREGTAPEMLIQRMTRGEVARKGGGKEGGGNALDGRRNVRPDKMFDEIKSGDNKLREAIQIVAQIRRIVRVSSRECIQAEDDELVLLHKRIWSGVMSTDATTYMGLSFAMHILPEIAQSPEPVVDEAELDVLRNLQEQVELSSAEGFCKK